MFTYLKDAKVENTNLTVGGKNLLLSCNTWSFSEIAMIEHWIIKWAGSYQCASRQDAPCLLINLNTKVIEFQFFVANITHYTLLISVGEYEVPLSPSLQLLKLWTHSCSFLGNNLEGLPLPMFTHFASWNNWLNDKCLKALKLWLIGEEILLILKSLILLLYIIIIEIICFNNLYRS